MGRTREVILFRKWVVKSRCMGSSVYGVSVTNGLLYSQLYSMPSIDCLRNFPKFLLADWGSGLYQVSTVEHEESLLRHGFDL